MTRILTKLRIDEVSSVDKGAGAGVKIVLMKRDQGDTPDDQPYMFDEIILRKAAVSDPLRGPREEDGDKKLSAKLDEIVAEMIVARPSLGPNRARRWLLHTERGQALLAQYTTKTEKAEQPMQVDIHKLVSFTEDALMARAKLTKRDDESEAKAFSRLYENDLDFRRQWATVNEMKRMLSPNMTKGYATLKPTSTEVGDTNVADDSAEAIRLLNEMAEKQHRTFEQVFSDPANKALAGQTYTGAHRPTTSSPSGSELQRR